MARIMLACAVAATVAVAPARALEPDSEVAAAFAALSTRGRGLATNETILPMCPGDPAQNQVIFSTLSGTFEVGAANARTPLPVHGMCSVTLDLTHLPEELPLPATLLLEFEYVHLGATPNACNWSSATSAAMVIVPEITSQGMNFKALSTVCNLDSNERALQASAAAADAEVPVWIVAAPHARRVYVPLPAVLVVSVVSEGDDYSRGAAFAWVTLAGPPPSPSVTPTSTVLPTPSVSMSPSVTASSSMSSSPSASVSASTTAAPSIPMPTALASFAANAPVVATLSETGSSNEVEMGLQDDDETFNAIILQRLRNVGCIAAWREAVSPGVMIMHAQFVFSSYEAARLFVQSMYRSNARSTHQLTWSASTPSQLSLAKYTTTLSVSDSYPCDDNRHAFVVAASSHFMLSNTGGSSAVFAASLYARNSTLMPGWMLCLTLNTTKEVFGCRGTGGRVVALAPGATATVTVSLLRRMSQCAPERNVSSIPPFIVGHPDALMIILLEPAARDVHVAGEAGLSPTVQTVVVVAGIACMGAVIVGVGIALVRRRSAGYQRLSAHVNTVLDAVDAGPDTEAVHSTRSGTASRSSNSKAAPRSAHV